jgi:hypothetical protein
MEVVGQRRKTKEAAGWSPDGFWSGSFAELRGYSGGAPRRVGAMARNVTLVVDGVMP